MFKKLVFFTVLIFVIQIAWKQDASAKAWERHNTTVQADSILAAIDQGKDVFIDSCEILDPLVKIGAWENPDTIRNSIRITHTTFHDTVSFLSCCFLRDVCFDSSIFLERVSFFHTTFNDVSAFSGVRFHNLPSFFLSVFTQEVNFSGATFSEGAAFSGAIFGGYASFAGATIRTLAEFFEARFDTTVNFSGVKCGLGQFVMVSFNGDAFFRDASFEKTNFREAHFRGIVDFSLKELKDIAVSWDQLKGHLWFFKPTVYKLMKYFEEQRQLDDADGVYLFLKKNETFEMKWYELTKYWGYLMWVTCGYGVKPQNTIYLSIIIILVFTLFYTKSDAIKEIEKEFGHRRKRGRFRAVHKSLGSRFYNALYFSVNTFIIGVVCDWHPTDDFLIKTKKIRLFKFRTLSMIEGALGWILLVLFVVTLTRKFIR